MVFIYGVQPGLGSGAGRFISYLDSHVQKTPSLIASNASDVKSSSIFTVFNEVMIHIKRRSVLWFNFLNLTQQDRVVLFHFQNIGSLFLLILFFFRKKTEVYMLDSSFFCVEGYNYTCHESEPCLRCLGSIDVKESMLPDCKIKPYYEPFRVILMKFMALYAKKGKILFYCQNKSQQDLLFKHYGNTTNSQVVGLWTSDFENLPATFGVSANVNGYDVVYHGSLHNAKGFNWFLEVCSFLPNDIKVLIPSSLPSTIYNIPSNIEFRMLSWENGLMDEVIKSQLTVVPSLWSAPIEGALVKSIYCSKKVAVVKNSTSYSSELNSSLVLKLNPNAELAASEIKKYLSSNDGVSFAIRQEWYVNIKSNFIFPHVLGGRRHEGYANCRLRK